MSGIAKRIFTELNQITIENNEGPNSMKFIIDETPFPDDPSEPTKIEKDDNGEYYIIKGRTLPTSNIYNQSAFKIKIRVPAQYPFKPPDVRIQTPIYHPNIGEDGKICLPLTAKIWRPTSTLNDVVNAIIDYIDHPNLDEPYSSEIAEEYLKRRPEFDRKAKECVKNNMVPRV